MDSLKKDERVTLTLLEKIIDEKRLVFKNRDHALFSTNNANASSLVPRYTLAKWELKEAVARREAYLNGLTSAYVDGLHKSDHSVHM